MSAARMRGNSLGANRSLLRWVAIILFILAAIFLFFVKRIGGDVDLGLIALGLAAWALA